jgi:hypothetical protein
LDLLLDDVGRRRRRIGWRSNSGLKTGALREAGEIAAHHHRSNRLK